MSSVNVRASKWILLKSLRGVLHKPNGRGEQGMCTNMCLSDYKKETTRASLGFWRSFREEISGRAWLGC